MQTSDFDYHLPEERIAQSPIEPRDHSRLLVLDRKTGTWQHQHFFEIGNFLRPGDLLIVNESKVFKARLVGAQFIAPGSAGMPGSAETVGSSGSIETVGSAESVETVGSAEPGVINHAPTIEIFLLRPQNNYWIALAKPGRKLKEGTIISFKGGSMATVIEKLEDGTVVLDFKKSAEEIFALADKIGNVPTPPYVKASESNDAAYQTVYAKQLGSVAAPTAGFHFTQRLINELKEKGINFASITLHVGLGTFRPIKTDSLEDHVMHEEWIDIPEQTLKAIQETKKNGGRVISVGTTTARALESNITHGFTNIFITPGYKFKTIDALITNFHLPKSSLLVLISALAEAMPRDNEVVLRGRELVLNAYQDAIQHEYRFYSFGDAMFIQ